MNRNTENRFGNIPQLNMQRSTFDISQNIKTTFNAGQLIPFFIDLDVLPGDTYKTGLGIVCRALTPIYPVMDNCYLDTYFFYIPSRILWTHWKEFHGENRTTAWVQPTEYEIPMFTTPSGGASKGTIMDYMGIPTGIAGIEFSQLGTFLTIYIKPTTIDCRPRSKYVDNGWGTNKGVGCNVSICCCGW